MFAKRVGSGDKTSLLLIILLILRTWVTTRSGELSMRSDYVFTMSCIFGRRIYLSGAAKRKQKRQQLEAEVKKRRTLEEFGWGVKKDAKLTDCASFDVDRSVDELSELGVNSDQPADTVAEECSTVSDHSGSDTDKSTQVKYNQLLPQHLSGLCLPSNDPAKWKQLTRTDKEVIVVNGPPQIPLSFPRDSFGRHFPENIFHETLPNGEKGPGIGLCGVSLLKDCSAFLVVFSKAVSKSCMYRCLASLMQVSKITGENCMKEFRAISVILLTCHATMTGKAWKQV